jgi:hypothetical protein
LSRTRKCRNHTHTAFSISGIVRGTGLSAAASRPNTSPATIVEKRMLTAIQRDGCAQPCTADVPLINTASHAHKGMTTTMGSLNAKGITVSPCLWKVVNLVRVLQLHPMLDVEGDGGNRHPKVQCGWRIRSFQAQELALRTARQYIDSLDNIDNGYIDWSFVWHSRMLVYL